MLEFVFWDVQHGSACYIHTPNDRHIAMDLGTGSYGTGKPFSPLLHLKNRYGVARLDYVVITHPHRDHLDDIFNFSEVNPKALRRPGHLSESDVLAGNKKEDAEKVKEYLKVKAGYMGFVTPGSSSDAETPEQWGDVKMSFFVTPDCDTKNLNNHSIVTVFEYATSKIIIPGDNEKESWGMLIKDQRFVTAAQRPDVLVAPHHGRQSGYCQALFDAVGKPYITIISDGPYCDSSATDCYGGQSKGWLVYYPGDTSEQRYCVTTRQDGVIRVRAYFASDGKPRLNVLVQRCTATKC